MRSKLLILCTWAPDGYKRLSSHVSYFTSPTSHISQMELLEYRYTNDPIKTLILATYLKVTSLTGFIVNATAVHIANSVSTRFFCYWYSYERPKLDFCLCCIKQHHKESLEHNKLLSLKPHNVSEYDIYSKNHYSVTDKKTFMLAIYLNCVSSPFPKIQYVL